MDNSAVQVSSEVEDEVNRFLKKGLWAEWDGNIGQLQELELVLSCLTLPKLSPTWESLEPSGSPNNSNWEKSKSLAEAEAICKKYEKLIEDVQNKDGNLHSYVKFVRYHFLIIAWVLDKDYQQRHHIKDDQVHGAIKLAIYGTAVTIFPTGSRSHGLTYKTFWNDNVTYAARGCKLLSKLRPLLGGRTYEIPLHTSKLRYDHAEEYIIRQLIERLKPSEQIDRWISDEASAVNIVKVTLGYRMNAIEVEQCLCIRDHKVTLAHFQP